MSSVLPINTQRYESGDYTLEVTAHPSPLSQWSDRPVVRQLRFSLWLEQPTRRRLAAGDQQQLVALSDIVEAYVQRHLTHAAWPSTHYLQLLGQSIELSTMQLFNLAEVLNAYGQRQITLPTAKVRPRRRWTGSAVASLLVAVGVATVYLQYRPDAFDQAETAQAPEVVLEDEVSSTLAPDAALPEAGSAPTADALDVTPTETEFPEPRAASTPELPRDTENSVEPALPEKLAQAGQRTAEPETLGNAASELAPPAVAPASEPPNVSEPAPVTESEPPLASQEEITAVPPPAGAGEIDDLSASRVTPSVAMEDSLAAHGGGTRAPSSEMNDVLDAIASYFAPYQPMDSPYPLVYHLQIAPDGTVTAIEPLDAAPAIALPNQVITPPPGRFLQVELIYTETGPPTVKELPQ